MKNTVMLIGLLIATMATGFAQTSKLDMYYPEDKLYKMLKVKSVVDTIASPLLHHYKKEYDTLGRQISWYYIEDKIVTRFRYEQKVDTLIKYHYYTEKEIEHDVYRVELFVYNKQGHIVYYQSCNRNYGKGKNATECRMDKLFYDEKNRITSRFIYSKMEYKEPFTPELRLKDSLLKLTDVYSYQYNKKSKPVLMKQMIGMPEYRSTDSFYYDKANRLIKTVSRQKQGYLGEFAVSDLCRTTTLKYEKNKRTETKQVTYSGWETYGSDNADAEISEYVFYPNGLQWMWFYRPDGALMSLLDYSVYTFYE